MATLSVSLFAALALLLPPYKTHDVSMTAAFSVAHDTIELESLGSSSVALVQAPASLIVTFPTAMRTLAAAASYEVMATSPVASDDIAWHRIHLPSMKMPGAASAVLAGERRAPRASERVLLRLKKDAQSLRRLDRANTGPIGFSVRSRGRGDAFSSTVSRGSTTKGRTQFLALEDGYDQGIDYLPDNDEDVRAKDASVAVREIYRPFAPIGTPMLNPTSEDSEDYASFYRAYSAYQLPREASNSLQNLGALGSDNLPKHAYPYSQPYYPDGGGRASVTINANGAGSTNSFNVAGPGAINVNFGGGEGGGGSSGGYVYPDGKTAVPKAEVASVDVSGGPKINGAVGEGEQVGGEEGCDPSNTDCQFWQDAYDDAEW